MKSMTCYMSILGALTVLGGVSGCANYEVNTMRGNIPGHYIRYEMQEADRAVEAARSAGKDKVCPIEFKAAEDAKNKAYDVFRQCRTEEGAALAKQATAMANALCPPQAPKPAPVAVPAPKPAPPVPTAKLSASPVSIYQGQSTTLSWSSQNSSECAIQPGVGTVQSSGTANATPAANATYKLVCTGEGGTANSSANVGVIQDSDKDGVFDDRDKCPDTPSGTKVDKNGCPLAVCKVITLDLEFDFNKADIKAKDHDKLKIVAESMKSFDTATVLIEGHTDSKGSPNYNMKLSQRRADAVRKFIIEQHGIAAERLTTKGFGETKPVASNATEAGRAKNRRVDAIFTCH